MTEFLTEATLVRSDTMSGSFIVEDNICYAGRHLLIDLYDCNGHITMTGIEDVMVEACKATGATVMFHYSHPFPGGGSSGAVILAESHGTWHHWVEEKFIAIDIFVCGDCDPQRAMPILETYFKPARSTISLEKRGIVPR